MSQTRAADDFATIRARMEELRRERERTDAGKIDLQSDPRAQRVALPRPQDRAMSICVLRAFSSLPGIEVDDDDSAIIGARTRHARLNALRLARRPTKPEIAVKARFFGNGLVCSRHRARQVSA